MTQPDILMFMTDQHTATMFGAAGDPIVSTPNLDRLAAEGVMFDNTYTSCPLCVPARSSMLTGQLPSRTGILTNSGIIPGEQATFVHSLAAAGYETVLCGRMHFLGPDQRHGFIKRLVGDFTPCWHGRYGSVRDDLGPYVKTPGSDFDKLYGGGTSPVLEYDKAVIAAAIDYLKQPHEKPVFLLVGTYAPHHTFVAPPELYKKYLDLVPPPDSASEEQIDSNSILDDEKRVFEPDVTHKLRAAYYGMIENVDTQIGQVHEAWDEFLSDNKRKGVFCYTSDHGEQAGEKEMWGKMSFYELSARIPMIFSGEGIRRGVEVDAPMSIMDISPTLCDIAGATAPPDQDGVSLHESLVSNVEFPARPIFSELLLQRNIPARMVRKDNWKYMIYTGNEVQEQLFDIEKDPGEYHNCLAEQPEIAAELKAFAMEGWDADAIRVDQDRRRQHWKILSQFGENPAVPEPERWSIPESAWELPKP